MKLLKFHLRYHPPGIILEYTKKGNVKSKDIDLLELNCNSDVKQIADNLQQKEALITDEVREQLEQCLVTLKKRIEHEGPTGKRFYIYKTLVTHLLPLTNVAFDKAGSNNLVVTGSFDKSARIWRVETGECIYTLWGHSAEIVSVQFAPRGGHVATASMDHTAKLYDALTGTEVHTYTGHTAEVIALQFDPTEGQHLISGSFDGTIFLSGHTAEISNAQYNWDSSLVGSASLDGSAKLWDTRERTCIATVTAATAEVLDVCFDWAGRRLATAGSDGTARVYEARVDCRELATMQGHREEVSKVCFSPAGGCLLTASADKTARIWNASTGNCIQVLSGHQGEIFSCAFSYAGDTIVTASKDNTCRIWR
ncbi:unnamed protein product [Parnassius apollo]|uniref:(apollo) hypothetical protein n=1 Tax=Parnassius apollo TaxID=110799 RepID=A0A8S3WAY2_PARAO|nr:unnamed protein product [Parnassius apollo]